MKGDRLGGQKFFVTRTKTIGELKEQQNRKRWCSIDLKAFFKMLARKLIPDIGAFLPKQFIKFLDHYRLWRTRRYLKRLNKMLVGLNDRLRANKFNRHDRRRFLKEVLKSTGKIFDEIEGYKGD